MNFIELTLTVRGKHYLSGEVYGKLTINPNNIAYVKEADEGVMVRTKLGHNRFYITQREYDDKIKHLFSKDVLELSFGRMFIRDIEGFWYDKIDGFSGIVTYITDDNIAYYLQTSWSDVKVAITKKDYDMVIEVIHLKNSNTLELLISGELFNFSHNKVREYLYWKDRNGAKTYIKDFSDEYLVNLIDFLEHTVVKRDCNEKWLKVLNNEIEFRRK